MPYIRTVFPDVEWDCIYDDPLMASLIRYKGAGGRDGYFPDGLWFYNGNSLIIEVGRFNLAKLPRDEQMIHIGWDGQVNVVNPRDGLVLDVADAIGAFRMEFNPLTTHPAPATAKL